MDGINRRLAPVEITDALKKRLDSRLDKSAAGGCWNWLASTRMGYGAIKIGKKVHSAHRLAFVIAFGEPGDGLIVAHKCDNRLCCNPDHLEAVTPAQNNRDAARINNRAFHARGEHCGNAVLNDQIVREIRKLRLHGLGPSSIASQLGVSFHAVKGVVEGRTWSHVK